MNRLLSWYSHIACSQDVGNHIGREGSRIGTIILRHFAGVQFHSNGNLNYTQSYTITHILVCKRIYIYRLILAYGAV